MNLKIYAVFDSKAAFFGTPYFDQNDGSAIRNFSDAVNDGSNPNNMWNKHPEDFSLYFLGEYENTTGEIIPSLPKSLVTASAIKELKYEKQIGDELRVLTNSESKQSA